MHLTENRHGPNYRIGLGLPHRNRLRAVYGRDSWFWFSLIIYYSLLTRKNYSGTKVSNRSLLILQGFDKTRFILYCVVFGQSICDTTSCQAVAFEAKHSPFAVFFFCDWFHWYSELLFDRKNVLWARGNFKCS